MRATCEGTSIRFASSVRILSRAISDSSSRSGRTRRTSTSRIATPGLSVDALPCRELLIDLNSKPRKPCPVRPVPTRDAGPRLDYRVGCGGDAPRYLRGRRAPTPLSTAYSMILRDPVHGLVSFETEEESIVPALLEARELQRLRRVRQTGL